MKKILSKTLGIGIVGLTILSTSGFIVDSKTNSNLVNLDEFTTQAYNSETITYNSDYTEIGIKYNKSNWEYSSSSSSKAYYNVMETKKTFSGFAYTYINLSLLELTDNNNQVIIAPQTIETFYKSWYTQKNNSSATLISVDKTALGNFSTTWKIPTSNLTFGYTYKVDFNDGFCSSSSSSGSCVDDNGNAISRMKNYNGNPMDSNDPINSQTATDTSNYTMDLLFINDRNLKSSDVIIESNIVNIGSNLIFDFYVNVDRVNGGGNTTDSGKYIIDIEFKDSSSQVLDNTIISFDYDALSDGISNFSETNIINLDSYLYNDNDGNKWNDDYSLEITKKFELSPTENITFETSIINFAKDDLLTTAASASDIIITPSFTTNDNEMYNLKVDYQNSSLMSVSTSGIYDYTFKLVDSNSNEQIIGEDSIEYDFANDELDKYTHIFEFDLANYINYTNGEYYFNDDYDLVVDMTYSLLDGTKINSIQDILVENFISSNPLNITNPSGASLLFNVESIETLDNILYTMDINYSINNSVIHLDDGIYNITYSLVDDLENKTQITTDQISWDNTNKIFDKNLKKLDVSSYINFVNGDYFFDDNYDLVVDIDYTPASGTRITAINNSTIATFLDNEPLDTFNPAVNGLEISTDESKITTTNNIDFYLEVAYLYNSSVAAISNGTYTIDYSLINIGEEVLYTTSNVINFYDVDDSISNSTFSLDVSNFVEQRNGNYYFKENLDLITNITYVAEGGVIESVIEDELIATFDSSIKLSGITNDPAVNGVDIQIGEVLTSNNETFELVIDYSVNNQVAIISDATYKITYTVYDGTGVPIGTITDTLVYDSTIGEFDDSTLIVDVTDYVVVIDDQVYVNDISVNVDVAYTPDGGDEQVGNTKFVTSNPTIPLDVAGFASGLSGGAISGIIMGIVVGIGLIGGGIWFGIKKDIIKLPNKK